MRLSFSPRYKGELYLLPTLRLAWPVENSTLCNSYWIGIYWLQWSLHLFLTHGESK